MFARNQRISATSDPLRSMLDRTPLHADLTSEAEFLSSLSAAACTLEEAADEEKWQELERQCRNDLGLDVETLGFLLDGQNTWRKVRKRLAELRRRWQPSLATWRNWMSGRPRVVVILTDGQSIRTFLTTDACQRIAEWAELFVLSAHDVSMEVQTLGPHAHYLPTPPLIRRSCFDYLVGFAGFRHTGSPTIHRFIQRLEESLDNAVKNGTDLEANIRLWQIARAYTSYEDYLKLYCWDLKFFARAYALQHVAGLLRDIDPDLVLNTDVVSWSSRLWTRAAAMNGTPIVSAVISWDNMSTKTLLSEFVDTFLIWSEEMDEDFATSLPFLRGKPRIIVGSPQFEPIINGCGLVPRRDFFLRYGLDPAKKLILYTTGSKTLFPREPECLDRVLSHWRESLQGWVNIMVRLHPKDREGRYEMVTAKFPEVPFTLAGENLASDDDWIPTREDMALLVNQLNHCDLIINVASTMTLEGFVINKPSVNIGFNLGLTLNARYPMEDYYKSRHYCDIVDTGAAPLVKDYEELFAAIDDVLFRGRFDVEKQRRVLRQKCNLTEGSSERISLVLREFASRRYSLTMSKLKPIRFVIKTIRFVIKRGHDKLVRWKLRRMAPPNHGARGSR